MSDAHDASPIRSGIGNDAAHASKMDALGRLAGGVAHDFNNLLTSIRGLAALALDELDPKHPVRADLQEILKAAERATDVTRDLLAFSRKQRMEIEPVDLDGLVASVVSRLRSDLPAGIELRTMLDARCHVSADPALLRQAITNLVTSAQHAIGNDGTIHIQTAISTVAASGAVPAGKYALLRVIDDAIVPAQHLDTVFEPFSPARGTAKATALTLAVTYGIITQAGGHIAVASEPGKGTIFSVILPVAPAGIASDGR